MPIPTGVCRINLRATIAGGEQMVHTLHGLLPSELGFDTNESAARTIANDFARLWTASWGTQAAGASIRPLFGQATRFTAVDAYVLGPDLRSIAQGTAALDGDIVQGSATNVLPNEVAMAVSFDTGRAGRTGRGRVYMGGFGVSVLAADGRFTATSTSNMANWWRDFLQALNNAPGDGGGAQFSAHVVSRVAQSTSRVRTVRVGDVPDVQRRRRNRLRETYAVSPLAS